MKIAISSDSELRAMGLQLAEAASAPRTEVFALLTALGLANRAAYLMSHADGTTMQRPNLEATPATEFDATGWELGDWCRNLLFNCISSTGISFAPKPCIGQLQRLMNNANCEKG